MDNLYITLVLSLFYFVNTGTVPTVVTVNTEATTSSPGCNTTALLECAKGFTKFVNVSSNQPLQIDHAAMYNFSCGSGAGDYIECVNTKVKPFCTRTSNLSESEKFVMDIVFRILPTIEQLRKMCSTMNEADYIGIGKCVVGMNKVEPYMDCVKGVGNTTDICSIIQISVDCGYKYMDLRCPQYADRLEEYVKATKLANCTVNIEKDAPKACDKNMYKACVTKSQRNITSATEAIQYSCSEDGIASTTCARKVKNICINSNQSVGLDILDVLPSADKTRKMCADKEGIKKYSECYSKFGQTIKFQNCTMPTDQDVKFCSILKQTHKCIEIGIQDHCPSSSDFFKKYMSYELEAGHPCAFTTSAAASGKILSIAYLIIVLLFFKMFN